MLYAKYALAGLFVASLIILGWTANGWRLKAAQADVARIELRNEIERRVKADADRLSLQVKLSEAEARIGTGVRIVTKTIRQYVHDEIDCRLHSPVSDGLRSLRAGELPLTTPEPATARTASGP